MRTLASGSSRIVSEPGDAKAHDAARREEPFLHEAQHVDAARLHDRGAVGRPQHRLRDGGRPGFQLADAGDRDRFERLHARLRRDATRPSAASTVAGVIGSSRMRTPIALYTAFAMAGAVAMFAGSAMPYASVALVPW